MIRLITAFAFSLVIFSSKAELLQSVVHNDVTYNLCAKERVTKGIFFDVVDVGIYYPDCSSNKGIFDGSAKLLRFSYLREVEGIQFTEGAEEYLEENLSAEEKSRCQADFKKLNAVYKDVVDGHFYDLYILPDQGIKLYLNQEHLADMTNTSCDTEYLNVWFGKESMDSDFRKLNKKLKSKAS